MRRLESLVRRLLRVPPQPAPPEGAPESIQTFRAAKGFLRLRQLKWALSQLGTLLGVVFTVVGLGLFEERLDDLALWIRPLEVLAVLGVVTLAPVSFLLISLDYRYRWYMITDRSLRIREGVWRVQERTMTFSNVQNVSIRQGPLQRLFGVADVEVRTAGGGGGEAGGDGDGGVGDQLHVGYFRGVANAAEIRNSVLRHLRNFRASGLGDPDEVPELASAERDSEVIAAAREVLAAVRSLRGVPEAPA